MDELLERGKEDGTNFTLFLSITFDRCVCRSVTLVGESDRKMLKAVIKHSASADQIRHRVVPPEFVSKWVARLDELKDEVSAVLKEEKEEKQVSPEGRFIA